jgi:DNA-directed RNA polymerase subunit RPC12/RpoP
MPAYVQRREIQSAFIVCPNCLRLPMYVRDVEPHWSVAEIDFIYECSDCGVEIKKTLTRPERRQ